MTQEQLRMQMLAGIITESQYKEENGDSITLTKDELETFLEDWDQGGIWSDTSRRIVTFLGKNPSDGL
jgi:hypothetical protein